MTVFAVGLPPCAVALDVNDDSFLDISDAIYLLESIFNGGPLPPEPTTECGPDLDAVLPCTQPPTCP